jgi:Asp/Glu/hydantoin racemase
MQRLLVINPNTSAAVTQDLAAQVRLALGPGVDVQFTTARFGAPYIADEPSYAVAAHATLDAWARHGQQHPEVLAADAGVLIGCFGDPGLLALRACAAGPVTGLAAAALAEAAALTDHGPCAIVTGGHAWGPMLERICRELPHGDRVQGIVTVDMTGGDMRAHPERAHQQLLHACHTARQRHPQAKALIVGGAALGGWAARLQAQVDVPLIDSVWAGARQAAQAPHGAGQGHPAWI